MNRTNTGRMMVAACAAAVLAGAMSADARPARNTGGAKYVFFFLGDGMGSAQIQATEAYLTQIHTGGATNPVALRSAINRLNMSKLPVQGMQTTFDDGALCTDSASAGTAFACGIKTKSGMIGMDANKANNYKSVAQLAKEQGKKVGILTSVSLDHATPAAYYASIDNRGKMNNIASQMIAAGYNFFGGGGLVAPTNAARAGDTSNDVWAAATTAGYTVKNTRAGIMALTNTPQDRVICINPWLQDSAAMPYEIDRPETNCSLAEMTRVAIECLDDDPDGFFMAIEGGKIDWACHANDAMATIGDMLDFDDSVAVALAFYAAHPNDTLIVVTGDHETGGMTIGAAKMGYSVNYGVLTNQNVSFQAFGANEIAAYKAGNTNGFDWTTMDIANEGDSEMMNLLASSFGLAWASLDEYEKTRLEAAYDKSMAGTNANSAVQNGWLYGSFQAGYGYEPIVVTATHIVNEKAGIGWTSYSHTGTPVPLFAVGFDSYLFAGFYDNTDIAKKIAAAMRIPQTLPVVK